MSAQDLAIHEHVANSIPETPKPICNIFAILYALAKGRQYAHAYVWHKNFISTEI